MRRREFLGFAAVASIAWPPSLRAQQVPHRPDGRPWLIGALIGATKVQSDIDSLGPFLMGMAALGYVEGRDYVVEARYNDGDSRLSPAIAKELAGLSPDLMLASNDFQIVAATTRTIPIIAHVGGASLDLVPIIIGSRARPVGNVTGMINDTISQVGKHCELALEIVPDAKRVGILVYPLNPDGGRGTRDAFGAAAAVRNFSPFMVEVRKAEELGPAFRQLADQRVDVAVVGQGLVLGDRHYAAQAAAAARVPAIYNEQGYVEAGGLISYGFDRKATYVRLASFADLILRGTRVADIPAEDVSSWIMAINLKTAKSLGLTIPPTVVFRADQLIE